MTLDGTLTVSDPDSGGNLTGATVSIGTGFITGDTLNFTNQNGITGSYDAAHRRADADRHRDASPTTRPRSNSITYSFSPANGDPTDGGSDTSRTIDWTVNDGDGELSNTGDQHARHGARGADGDGRRHRDLQRRRLAR